MANLDFLGGIDPTNDGNVNGDQRKEIYKGPAVVKSLNTGMTVDTFKATLRAQHEGPWRNANESFLGVISGVLANLGKALSGITEGWNNSFASSEIEAIASSVREPLGQIRTNLDDYQQRIETLRNTTQQQREQQDEISEKLTEVVTQQKTHITSVEAVMEGIKTRLGKTQEEVDDAQDKVLRALGEAQKLDLKFQEESLKWQSTQESINDALQDQIWANQDALETLENAAPKIFFLNAKDSDGRPLVWGEAQLPLAHPRFNPYFSASFAKDDDGPVVTYKGAYIAFALCRVAMTNGALDEFGNMILSPIRRTFNNHLGASHISCRSAVIELRIISYNRAAPIRLLGSNFVLSPSRYRYTPRPQDRDLVREIEQSPNVNAHQIDQTVTNLSLTRTIGFDSSQRMFVRFKNTVICPEATIVGQSGESYPAGTHIPPQRIYAEPNRSVFAAASGQTLTFFEKGALFVDNPSENMLYRPGSAIQS